MSLFQQLTTDRKQARLSKDKFAITVLGTVLGEIALEHSKTDLSKRPEEPSDEICLKVIKASLKSLEIMKDKRNSPEVEAEITLLTAYLPTLISSETLEEIITQRLSSYTTTDGNQMRFVMSFLQTNYPKQYDGKVASSILKRMTNNV